MLTDITHAKRTLFDVVDGSVGVLKRSRRDPVGEYVTVPPLYKVIFEYSHPKLKVGDTLTITMARILECFVLSYQNWKSVVIYTTEQTHSNIKNQIIFTSLNCSLVD